MSRRTPALTIKVVPVKGRGSTPPVHHCSGCGKRGTDECGRVERGNRVADTVGLPGSDSESLGDGAYRRRNVTGA